MTKLGDAENSKPIGQGMRLNTIPSNLKILESWAIRKMGQYLFNLSQATFAWVILRFPQHSILSANESLNYFVAISLSKTEIMKTQSPDAYITHVKYKSHNGLLRNIVSIIKGYTNVPWCFTGLLNSQNPAAPFRFRGRD